MPLGNLDLHSWWWLAFAALLLLLFYALLPVLVPFFIAAIFGYICQPAVFWLERHRVQRVVAVLLVMLLELLLLALMALTVMPLFFREITLLLQQLPAFLDWLNRNVAPWLAAHLGTSVSFDPESLKTAINRAVQGNEGAGARLLDSLRIGGLGLAQVVGTLVLVPIVQFFLMRDWERILAHMERLVPRRWHRQTVGFVQEADEALARYLHGQVLVILVMSTFYTCGLWLTGLSSFLPIGVITGVLVFIPYIGAAIGFTLGTLAALMQFQDWNGVLWVWAVFGLGWSLEGYLVTPKLVGARIGLHPVAVIFSLLAFGQLFGVPGLLLALPATAVLIVALRRLQAAYIGSRFYSDHK